MAADAGAVAAAAAAAAVRSAGAGGRGGLGGGRQGGRRAEAAGAGGPGTAGRRRQVDDVAQAQPQWVIWVSLQSVSKPANSTLVKSLPNGDDCQCGLAAKQ